MIGIVLIIWGSFALGFMTAALMAAAKRGDEVFERGFTPEQAPYGVCPDCGFAYGSADARPCSEQGGPF